MGQIYVYFGKIKALFTIIGITMDWWKCNRNKRNGNGKFTRKIYHHVTVAREMYVIVFAGVSFVIRSQMSAMCNSHFAELTSAVTTLPSHNRTIIVIYEIRLFVRLVSFLFCEIIVGCCKIAPTKERLPPKRKFSGLTEREGECTLSYLHMFTFNN